MKIRPLHDHVVVRREDEARTSPGGILIPDTASEKPSRGTFIAIGNGKQLAGEEQRVLREGDIMGAIT